MKGYNSEVYSISSFVTYSEYAALFENAVSKMYPPTLEVSSCVLTSVMHYRCIYFYLISWPL